MTRPAKSILDPTFKYTNAAGTRLALTFARIRKELKAAEELRVASAGKVKSLIRSKT